MSTPNQNDLDFFKQGSPIGNLGGKDNYAGFDFFKGGAPYLFPKQTDAPSSDTVNNTYITGLSRIQNSYDTYITGVSRIETTSDTYITGLSRIQVIQDSYITGLGRIQKTVLRPTGDISAGSWGIAPLYSKIDEISPDSSDYISSSILPSSDTCILGLTQTGTPINRENHNIRYSIKRSDDAASLNLRCALYEGNTLIGSGIHLNIPSSFTITGFSLSEAQANNITNYNNLRLHFTASTEGF